MPRRHEDGDLALASGSQVKQQAVDRFEVGGPLPLLAPVAGCVGVRGVPPEEGGTPAGGGYALELVVSQ